MVFITELTNSLTCIAYAISQSNFLVHPMHCSEDYWIRSVAVTSLKHFQNFTHPPRCNNCKAHLAFSACSLLCCTELNPNLNYKLSEEAHDVWDFFILFTKYKDPMYTAVQ